jgi:Zn-finger nucleic acid-binding protein
MNCANCGAPARLDRERGLFVCDYCGGEFVPPLGADGVQDLGLTKLLCPACGEPLSDGRLEQVDLLHCTSCRGMLIDMDKFMGVVEVLHAYRDRPATALPRPNEDALNLPRHCPRCSGDMMHHMYGGPGNVFIDTCETCSVNWLDQGELQRIAAAPDPAYNTPLYSDYGTAEEPEEKPRSGWKWGSYF